MLRVVAAHCDLLVVHDETTAASVRRWRPRGQVVVMPHGNYREAYPKPRPRHEVLAELELREELPVVVALGQIRPYKGLDVLSRSVREVAHPVQFIVAGVAKHPEAIAAWRHLSAVDPKIRLIEGGLTSQQFADLAAAAEIHALPYRGITGSGAIHTAFTFGRGVVASDLPYFREVTAGEPDAAVFAPPGDAVALGRAIDEILGVPAARRQAAAVRLRNRYEWSRCVSPLAVSLREEVTKRRGTAPSSRFAGGGETL